MEPSEPVQLSERVSSQIKALSTIATANGTFLSLNDIIRLTSIDHSRDELQTAWPSLHGLSSRYILESGLVADASTPESSAGTARIAQEMSNRDRAEAFVRYARDFAAFNRQENTSLLAVSGSASYQSASQTDDLDLFSVTQPDSLWVFLTKALLTARLFRLTRKNSPRICFSYAVDENYAAKEFSVETDALFARDALTTIVIQGEGYYKRLLTKSPWMSKYFPRAYNQLVNATPVKAKQHRGPTTKPSRRFLNLFLWTLLGRYIAVKSGLLNRKFRKQKRPSSFFILKTGPDHCVFESTRYMQLREMYRGLHGDLSSANPTSASTRKGAN